MFHLLFSLITLPFTILGSLLGLFGLSTRILLFPLKIFARHTVLCLVIIGGVILYYALKSDPHSLDSLKPIPAENKPVATPKGATPVVEQVAKIEDGDSAFATDLYTSMTNPERNYYSGAFYTAMGKSADGKAYDWAYYNINGSLRPVTTFRNNSGDVCRRFTETLKVHRIQQTLSGIACDNGDGTWCKLKINATPACGLGHEPGAFEGITNSIKNLF